MVYNDLRIQYFKGIKELYMPDLRRINLLVGKNDCGKSSVLEALYLLIPDIKNDFEQWNYNDILNNFNNSGERDAYSFFHFRNIAIKPEITAQIIFGNGTMYEKLKIDNLPRDQHLIFKIEIKRYNDNFSTVLSSASGYYDPSEYYIRTQRPDDNFPYKKSYYWGHHSLYQKGKNWILDYGIERQIEIGSVLQKIDPRIQSFRFKSNNAVEIVLSDGIALPISYFGDGVKRSLYLLSALSYCQDGILLIDEVDTGLHHSALIPVWKALIEGAKRFNVQLFITTHSDECAEALHAVMQADYPEIMEEEYVIFRIEKKGEDHKVIAFTPEKFNRFLELNWEYR